jgi:prephenate dehydrogenase
MINKLAIIGIGLIGGSLARALRESGYVREIVGFSRTLATVQEAIRLGVIDRAAVSVVDTVREADVVVIAVPIGGMLDVFALLAEGLADRAIVTDVGSVKGSVIAGARPVLGAKFRRFVPGHPLAGTEDSGLAASTGDLFRGRRTILTPEPETDADAVERVRALWHAAGAEVVTMSASAHDEILAASSHLPHLIAYALVDMFVRMDNHRAIFENSAGGFRDFTRIASSDPEMWRDICMANREAILSLLRQFQGDVDAMIRALVFETFTRAKRVRDALIKKD